MDDDELARRQGFSQGQGIKLLFASRETEIRDKCDAETDARQIDEQIVAA